MSSRSDQTTKPAEAPLPELERFMGRCGERVVTALEHRLPPETAPPTDLHAAMRYAVLAGGKYIRPVLVYATGEAFGADPARLDAPACAVELIHAYSLVHDDLPAMDDDALRRGKPSCHIAHGEAMAILAGDALQALAFHCLASDTAGGADAAERLRMIDTLAVAAGSHGMAGGQAVDLASVGHTLALEDLENMHLCKTGALIRASVQLGALAAGARDEAVLRALGEYARRIGLAFQIRDDILDVEGDPAILGKARGADVSRNKPTYCSLLGTDGARELAGRLHEEAISHIEGLGERAMLLRAISEYIVHRVR